MQYNFVRNLDISLEHILSIFLYIFQQQIKCTIPLYNRVERLIAYSMAQIILRTHTDKAVIIIAFSL